MRKNNKFNSLFIKKNKFLLKKLKNNLILCYIIQYYIHKQNLTGRRYA